MADSTEGDTDVLHLGFLVLALIALIAGLVIHSFIIGVNVTDWWKGRPVTAVDHIVTSLGISRMCSQSIATLGLFLITLFSSIQHLRAVILTMAGLSNFFMYVNYWLTSLLSILFYLKISNLQTRLFLYLRRMIVDKTVYFIVAAVLLSAVSSGITFMKTFTKNIYGGTYNTMKANFSTNCTSFGLIFSFTIVASIPMFFSCISSVLLFTSLYHHTAKMKMSSNLSIKLETYYSVMKFISFTLIYKTIYYFGFFTCTFFNYFYCARLVWLYIVLEFLPALHSCYLIYRTAKLRSQMSKALQVVTDFLLQRKSFCYRLEMSENALLTP
ncbi:hypothetical protein GDO78_015097 [Eleutherodactylus coqui]|uniref:Taste receptor type 2 n=1 Tax=Eleutherodactylus coqui TaxID=57060 RepID=A0A8J6BBS4_ELECQ|nr:hypothetical protein GDO78_015097 [Eleutherodactylus coqui]